MNKKTSALGGNIAEVGLAAGDVRQLIADIRAGKLGVKVAVNSLKDIRVTIVNQVTGTPPLQLTADTKDYYRQLERVISVAKSNLAQWRKKNMSTYSKNPILTRLMLRRVMRQQGVDRATRQQVQDILNHPRGAQAAGEVFDDLEADMPKTAKLGDGTLLKLILDNLPQIIQAIMEILKLFGGTVPASGTTAAWSEDTYEEDTVIGQVGTSEGASHGQSEFAMPDFTNLVPGIEAFGEQVLKTIWPLIEKKIRAYLDGLKGDPSALKTATSAKVDFALPAGVLLLGEQLVALIWPLVEKKINDFLKTWEGT